MKDLITAAKRKQDPERKIYKVKKRIVFKNAWILNLCGSIVLIAFLAISYIVQYAKIVQAETNYQRIKNEIEVIQRENKQLQLKLEGLKSPKRIDYIARNKLGMIDADSIYFLNYK